MQEVEEKRDKEYPVQSYIRSRATGLRKWLCMLPIRSILPNDSLRNRWCSYAFLLRPALRRRVLMKLKK